MPKSPIQSRELLYDRLRDNTIVLLDWCLVQTDLGGMLEPRSLSLDTGAMPAVDPYDGSFSRFTEIDADQMVALFNTGGELLPRDYVNARA